MKKTILIALIITGVITGSVIIGGFLAKNQKDDSSSTSSTNNQSTSSTQETAQNQSAQQSYTIEQVAEHNTKDNCWIIISQQVYDVTDFIPKHPGGASQIIAYCGKDATQAFATQGGEGSHSSTAESLKQDYLIGTLQ